MNANEVRKLGRILTRERLGLAPNTPISDWRIARTIHEDMGVTVKAVEHWLYGVRSIPGPATKLLKLLAQQSRPG